MLGSLSVYNNRHEIRINIVWMFKNKLILKINVLDFLNVHDSNHN